MNYEVEVIAGIGLDQKHNVAQRTVFMKAIRTIADRRTSLIDAIYRKAW